MLNTIQPKTKCDMVVDQIMSMIVKGVYKMGTQLPPENDLCSIFGVSRITIRESLKKLNMMGVVSIRQGKGTFVNSIDIGIFMKPLFQLIKFDEFDIKTIYDARLFIETGTCRLAAQNRTDKDIEILSDLLRRMNNAIRNEDLKLLSELDRNFHIQVAEASRNTLLKATVIAIEDISSACMQRLNKLYTFMDTACEHHTEILRCIEANDEEGAAEAMALHTKSSEDFLL